jgi:2-amino-4-hydroxy-6-hydroxymethyldihydropteridine diphosphokinase
LDELSSRELVSNAVKMLEIHGFCQLRPARLYASPCHPKGAGPDFVNTAVAAHFDGPAGGEPAAAAQAALEALHAIEAALGRVRTTRWAPRVIDLDLVDFGGIVLPDPALWRRWHDLPPALQARETPDRLILPHPRLQDRAFVLVPLADIAPRWRHPVLGLDVGEMRARLAPEDVAAVTLL